MSDDKVVCAECRWHGHEADMLTAPHPFDAADKVYGCPTCKSIDTLIVACDEPECWLESSCGTPTLSGYRRTCFEHVPKDKSGIRSVEPPAT